MKWFEKEVVIEIKWICGSGEHIKTNKGEWFLPSRDMFYYRYPSGRRVLNPLRHMTLNRYRRVHDHKESMGC